MNLGNMFEISISSMLLLTKHMCFLIWFLFVSLFGFQNYADHKRNKTNILNIKIKKYQQSNIQLNRIITSWNLIKNEKRNICYPTIELAQISVIIEKRKFAYYSLNYRKKENLCSFISLYGEK
jgi:hypothetical protein